MAAYGTPSQFWQFALSRASMFQELDFARGLISPFVKTGAGGGLVQPGTKSNPIDAFNCRLEVVEGGEVNQTDLVNPGPLPIFRLSLDGGTSYFNTETISPDQDVAYIRVFDLGITLEFRNGTAPSFVVGDHWIFATAPSPDVVNALVAASRLADGYLAATYRLPLLAWSEDLTWAVCDLARWLLIKRKGLSKSQDFEVYKPVEAMNWLAGVQAGNIRPVLTETPPPVLFPLLVDSINPLSKEAGSFPI